MAEFLDTYVHIDSPSNVLPNPDAPNVRGIIFIVFCLLLFTTSTTFGGIRVYTKALITRAIGWDDYTCICTLLGNVVWTVCNINMVRVGMGKHSWDVHNTWGTVQFYRHNSFVVNITYFLIIMLVKMSILFSYLRTFTASRLFRYTVWGVMFVLVTSHVSIFICFVVWTTPVRCAWIQIESFQEYGAICRHNYEWEVFLRLIIFSAVLTVILDIIIVALPCRPIWRLHLPKRQKIVILLTLASGIIVTVASILRLNFIIALFWHTGDQYVQEWQVNFISTIEINLALICICLPVLKAFTRRFCPSLLRVWYSSSGQHSTGGANSQSGKRAISLQPLSHHRGTRAVRRRDSDSHEVELVNHAAYVEIGEDGKSDQNVAMHAVPMEKAMDVDVEMESRTAST